MNNSTQKGTTDLAVFRRTQFYLCEPNPDRHIAITLTSKGFKECMSEVERRNARAFAEELGLDPDEVTAEEIDHIELFVVFVNLDTGERITIPFEDVLQGGFGGVHADPSKQGVERLHDHALRLMEKIRSVAKIHVIRTEALEQHRPKQKLAAMEFSDAMDWGIPPSDINKRDIVVIGLDLGTFMTAVMIDADILDEFLVSTLPPLDDEEAAEAEQEDLDQSMHVMYTQDFDPDEWDQIRKAKHNL